MVATVSGFNRSRNHRYDHAFAQASYFRDGGWELWSGDLDEFVVHAWCDLEPYGLQAGRTESD